MLTLSCVNVTPPWKVTDVADRVKLGEGFTINTKEYVQMVHPKIRCKIVRKSIIYNFK